MNIEQAREELDKDTTYYILEDEIAMGRFIEHVEHELDPKIFQTLLSGFLETNYGKRWYENCVEKITGGV